MKLFDNKATTETKTFIKTAILISHDYRLYKIFIKAVGFIS